MVSVEINIKTVVLAVTSIENYSKVLGNSRVKFSVLVLNLRYHFNTTAFNNISI